MDFIVSTPYKNTLLNLLEHIDADKDLYSFKSPVGSIEFSNRNTCIDYDPISGGRILRISYPDVWLIRTYNNVEKYKGFYRNKIYPDYSWEMITIKPETLGKIYLLAF